MTTNDNSSSTTNSAAEYWNDHYTGACFLNNLRLVETRQNPFLSLDVHVKQGKKEAGVKMKTQRVNVNVVGVRATAIINALLEKYDFTNGVKSESNANGHPPISAVFTIGDLWADCYISNTDQKPRAALKGRLVSLKHVYVDNERFDTPEEFGDSPDDSTTVDSEENRNQAAQTAIHQEKPAEQANPQDDVNRSPAQSTTVEQPDKQVNLNVNAEEAERNEIQRLMAVFAESTLDSNCISLDASDSLYKMKLRFLLNNGFIWSDNADCYVPKDQAA